ncbi:DOPA-like domain-containing protein [Rhodocollybia butyracea]|uniref:DOPA-like domain-containing protein n=1 Tax=Rhodocollybia butyracea TaxID=206335 RepID=A0A9P5PW05_9AGAR|nr:DOPA-like domain-containing protein [Rhodocollybia butyracea]
MSPDMDIDSPRLQPSAQKIVDEEIKEWLFVVYFKQKNADQYFLAMELRDAIIHLRGEGAFVAVPFYQANTDPVGPHPMGSYEIWVPRETFASVFSYICRNRGGLSVLVHPLTKEQRRDYESRACWMGSPLPLDLSVLSCPLLETEPHNYPNLKFGYSGTGNSQLLSPDSRKIMGQNVEKLLKTEKGAARAPLD